MAKGEKQSPKERNGLVEFFVFVLLFFSSGTLAELSSIWSRWLEVVFHFAVIFGTEGLGMGLGEPEPAPQGITVCSSYNPVAPKGIPEL